jgi:hypothetical protein
LTELGAQPGTDRFHPGFVANITSIMHNVKDFSQNMYMLCEKITLLASTKISMWRCMAATGKRRKEEKELGADDPLNKLPLATSAQVLEVIDKVHEAISKHFSSCLSLDLEMHTGVPSLRQTRQPKLALQT